MPEWANVSDCAKDLIHHLLEVNPEQRYSAKEVLQHEWLSVDVHEHKHAHHHHMHNAIEQLKKFNARRKFKKGVLAVASINKMQRLISSTKSNKSASISPDSPKAEPRAAPDIQTEKAKEEKEQVDIRAYFVSLNEVLSQNVQVMRTVIDKSPEMMQEVKSQQKLEEMSDVFQNIFENMKTMNEELTVFKKAYLNVLLNGKDFSKYFV